MTTVRRQAPEIDLDQRCELGCLLCYGRTAINRQELDRLLRQEPGGLLIRGGDATSPRMEQLLALARRAGVQDLSVRTHALAHADPTKALELSAWGATGVLVPLFSQHPQAHDHIAGRAGTLSRSLAGMRSLAAAGLAVEVEVPLLSPRVQDLVGVIDLAHRAVPTLAAVHLRLPQDPVPDAIVAPAWDQYAPVLARALARCDELGILAVLRSTNAVPFCALKDHPEHWRHFWFRPNGRRRQEQGAARAQVCESCATRYQCPGVARSYLKAHGHRGLVPFKGRPRALYEQRTTPSRVWTDEQREAARRAKLLVVRPTVNCNQDCTFCSANETSDNIWADKKTMLRAIARAGQRGVSFLSFSGGEPTLSRSLVDYVRAARRVGIEKVELVTNGVLLDTPKAVQALVEAGITRAFVSLHAHSEEISKWMTQKVGDWARTVRAIELLLDAGITVRVNHVISARNYRFLRRFVTFVHERFAGRVSISFAFVTPQYRALENIEVVPPLEEVMQHLRVALHQAVVIGQPFIVGSRQGIPPCFLREFQAWSDILIIAHEALSGDAPQKQRAPGCDDCRYGDVCTGLWKPYVARYGLGEIRPIPGTRLQPHDARVTPADRMRTFDDATELQRDREAEQEGRRLFEQHSPEAEAAADARHPLPVFTPMRSRPVRVALLGTGNRARRIAAAARRVEGLSIDAIASPHALDVDRSDFDACPVYSDAVAAMDDIRPEAVIVAAATPAHFELAREALTRGIAALVEKPLTRTDEEAEELIRLRQEHGGLLVPAHNVLHAPGIDEVLSRDGATRVVYARRCPPESSDAPRTWRPEPLYEMLYHAIVLTNRACRGGVAAVSDVHWEGASRPERIRFGLDYGHARADLQLDFTDPRDILTLTSQGDGFEVTWRREGRDATLSVDGQARPVERDGNDIERMLRQFRDTVVGKSAPGATAEEALDVMRTARGVLDGLAAAKAPFVRPNAPRHVASRALADRALR